MSGLMCYKVRVKTTNAMGGTVEAAEGYPAKFLSCDKDIIYVMSDSFMGAEQVVKSDCIISIECVGPGVVYERTKITDEDT